MWQKMLKSVKPQTFETRLGGLIFISCGWLSVGDLVELMTDFVRVSCVLCSYNLYF